jgi:hypothetical protein
MFQTLGLVNNELEEMGQENNPTSAWRNWDNTRSPHRDLNSAHPVNEDLPHRENFRFVLGHGVTVVLKTWSFMACDYGVGMVGACC